ncbi:uncharacterized protein LOC114740917 [Neltuma alba]|uniref:uncharacterized protein LOC114727903 n=1 Tax=Neltuma alba TaxID=207710 RepID=UPI0010A2B240|nr:uncharacterized protein LOC114727903 [Prosopis alba]XP_028785006.1 uncharacterized protein LOC114740917 [Prosopis alba]
MAENLDDGEFWLPPQFLDDDVFLEDTTGGLKLNSNALLRAVSPKDLFFPSEFPYDFESCGASSDLSSPVESVVGSSETESDEEERVPDLTRRMARTALEVDSTSDKPKEMFVSGSPQSTLWAFGSGCGCRKGSSNGSPNSAGKVSSPTATWDLLHAAAGEVEKMKLGDEVFAYNHNQRPLGAYPLNLPVSNSNPPEFKLVTHRPLSHQQLQILRFQMLREQQMAKLRNSSFGLYQQRRSNLIAPVCGGNSEISGPRSACPVSFSSPAWPQQAKFPAQTQQFGSGMRAVFLENPSGKKRECTGTGVFLPRRVDNPSESKRKPACSTVLVPDRVAQALNLNLDKMSGQPQRQEPPRFNVAPNMDSEAAFPKLQRNPGLHHQKRSLRPQPPLNHDLRLPQEWTY